jgi:uncharacterized protein (TIGR01370 family)
MSSHVSRARSVALRAVVGLAMLIGGVTAGALLMHAGIEPDGDRAEASITTASINRGPLARVTSWSPAGLTATADHDLIVVDPAGLGADSPAALPAAIDALKRREGGMPRLVLARMTIASASAQQLDWMLGVPFGKGTPPSWLDVSRTVKGGRWPVAFWSSEWQAQMAGSSSALVDRLAALGFDGVYIADGDGYLAVRGERTSAETEFVQLIDRLAQRGKAINPDFTVVLANAEELIAHPAIRSAIDAVAREDLFFGADETGRPNARSAIVAGLHFLDRWRREGRPVLVAERLFDPRQIAAVRADFARHGFVGTIVATRPAERQPAD